MGQKVFQVCVPSSFIISSGLVPPDSLYCLLLDSIKSLPHMVYITFFVLLCIAMISGECYEVPGPVFYNKVPNGISNVFFFWS